MKCALVCIAKNEDHYIEEWINYHKRIGFDDIVIYQNDWRYSGDDVIKFIIDGDEKQPLAYNDFLKNHSKEYDWIAFFDVDEFLVLKKHDNLHSLLEEYNDAESLAINWVIFGSNGHETVIKNNYNVLSRFTKRGKAVDDHIKIIVNTKYLNSRTKFINPHFVGGLSWIDSNSRRGNGPFNEFGSDDVVQLNHYFGKSTEEYKEKLKRGRSDSIQLKRTQEDYEQYDQNEIVDFSALILSK